MRIGLSTVVGVLLVAAAEARAQDAIARRVAAAPDGEVRMTYASRPGACGDGDRTVSFRESYYTQSMQGWGRHSGMRCTPGPVRVAVTVDDRRVVRVRTYVSGAWSAPGDGVRVTDLGTVSAPEAAQYFLSLVPQLERVSKSRVLLPVVLADSAAVVPQLLALGRDEARTRDTRHQAVHWAGMLGDASTVAPLVAIARGASDPARGDDDQGPGDGVGSAAAAALSFLPDDVGIPALIDLARSGTTAVRKNAVFWLGQSDDPRARRAVRAVIEDDRAPVAVRSQAVFALAHGQPTRDDFGYLRAIFPRLTEAKMQDQVLMAMAEEDAGGGAWLLARARDAAAPMRVRKNAIFWAGQRDAVSTAELQRLYRDLGATDDRPLREQVIFVFSQRRDDAATDALVAIARGDSDLEMRKKALFWLGQKKDPRVDRLIANMVLH